MRHSDRDAEFYCQKDNMYMCRECACCHTPRLYCKFRSSCIINILTREGELQNCEESRAASSS
ncbi:hypothetical protein [Desulfomonile tiedjei]